MKYYTQGRYVPITGTVVTGRHELKVPNKLQKRVYDNFQEVKRLTKSEEDIPREMKSEEDDEENIIPTFTLLLKEVQANRKETNSLIIRQVLSILFNSNEIQIKKSMSAIMDYLQSVKIAYFLYKLCLLIK